MPIIVKDYQWKQTESNLMIQVPIKGIHPSKADILCSERYVKASYEQYFFEVILLESIDICKSKCTILDKEITFELVKLENKIWDSLEPNLTRKEKFELKKKLIEEEHERFQKKCKEKSEKKSELKRVAVQKQIDTDAKNRKQIEEIKKNEETVALGDLNHWKKSLDKPKPKIQEIEKPEIILEPRQTKILQPRKNTKIKKADPVPKPRSTRSLQILFTPREFPTPSRESRLEEENEYLRKQAEARRSAGFVSEDIRPEERNPQFIKAKGDEFLKNKNYLGAISAYSFGIQLSENFVDLYISRSECHMEIGNYNRAINDCSKALELLKPVLPINKNERAICIGRRGVALCKMNMFKHGIGELEASVKLLPDPYFIGQLEELNALFEDLKRKDIEEDEKEKDKQEESYQKEN